MTIIQINKFYYLKGGAERYMLDVSRWLTEQGHKVIPFAMSHPENIETPYSRFFPSFVQTEQPSFTFSNIKTIGRMIYSFESRRKLSALLAETKPDVCHLHNIYTQLSPSILHTLAEHAIPVVMTVHDHHLISPQYNVWAESCGIDVRNKNALQAIGSRFHKHSLVASSLQWFTFEWHDALRMYEKNIHLFLCPSAYIKRQLVAHGFPEKKIRVHPFGIDTNKIIPAFDHQKFVLFVGRLSEEKGTETVVRLAQLLPDVQFKIVGTGPEMDWLHRLGHTSANLEFLGFQTGMDLLKLYQGATAVLVPSRVHEVFPLTILEAMASGKPVLASSVGGVPEIVLDRVNGFLLAPIDLPAWAEAILRLIYDDALAREMGLSARETVEKRFSIEEHYHRLLTFYDEVVSRTSAFS